MNDTLVTEGLALFTNKVNNIANVDKSLSNSEYYNNESEACLTSAITYNDIEITKSNSKKIKKNRISSKDVINAFKRLSTESSGF